MPSWDMSTPQFLHGEEPLRVKGFMKAVESVGKEKIIKNYTQQVMLGKVRDALKQSCETLQEKEPVIK